MWARTPIWCCILPGLTLSPSPASQRNFIVASVDVRGSGFQGEEYKHAVYRWSLNGRESIIAKTLKLFQLMIVKLYIYVSLFFFFIPF